MNRITGSQKAISPQATAVGAKLRAAREAAGLSQRELARQLNGVVDQAKISRAESGERMPNANEAAAMLALLGVTGEAAEEIMELVTGEPNGSSAWTAVGMPAQSAQLSALINFEQVATGVTEIAPLVIPGLLQISDYSRAIMRAAGTPAEEIATRVAIRVGRREILTRKDSPVHLTAFIGEAALRARLGGSTVMVNQLDHLLTMGALPNVDLRVFKIAEDWHPGLDGSALLLDIDKSTTVVFLENRLSGLFLQEEEVVAAYKSAADKVLRIAMSPEHSAEFIKSVAKQMRKE